MDKNLIVKGLGRFIWTTIFLTLGLTFLFASFPANFALASKRDSNSHNDLQFLALESIATLTPTQQIEATSAYSFSLTSLGYQEIILNSPYDTQEFSFRLPENWLVQNDGLLELNLSYSYDQIETDKYPSQYGNLTISFDDQTLEVFPIEERKLDNYKLRIPLPLDLFVSDQTQHFIRLEFDDGLLCDVPHDAKLIVHPTSFILLNYRQRLLELDLVRYPRPFYQQAFEPDNVYVALPSRPTTTDVGSALAVVAKLGDLTDNRMVISPTTDSDLSQLLSSSSPTFDEHLIVIGRPQDNKLLPLLNSSVQLPVSLHERKLMLMTQGPSEVAPNDIFTYTFTITNTTNQIANLSLIDSLPPRVTLIKCISQCLENIDNNIVTWNDIHVAPDKSVSFSLILKAPENLTEEVENNVTLYEADLGPINADTLTSTVVTNSLKRKSQVSVVDQEGYFFMYNNRAVAKEDGIIQEIVSPWEKSRAILIITGLSSEAVRKASQALSSETRFPGMSGPVALVRETFSPLEVNENDLSQVEMTLANLGYQDKILRGRAQQTLDYNFNVPFGWQLTDAATIDLYFNHFQLTDYQESGLTVLINRQPIASIILNDETARDGHLHIKLKGTNIQPGQNRLSVQVKLSSPVVLCTNPEANQVWFLLKSISRISLPHEIVPELPLDLDHFPHPFQVNRSLNTLLFALPDAPTFHEWGMALRLAESLGSSAAGKTLVPVVTFGNDLGAKDLENFQIIAIGRPSRNILTQQANVHLPQPFLPNSDQIEQRLDDVVFRLPSNISLGYIELIASPWNQEHAFLAITGTSDEGVEQATNILESRPWSLKGNLALINNDQVSTIDTRGLTNAGIAMAVATVLPEMTPVATITAVPTPSPLMTPSPVPTNSILSVFNSERTSTTRVNLPNWLIPLVGLNGLLVIAIFAFVFWQARHKRP